MIGIESAQVKLARQVLAEHERSGANTQTLAVLRTLRAVARNWGIGEAVLVDRSTASRARKHPDKRKAVSRARTAAALLLHEQGLRTRAIQAALELKSTASVPRLLRRALRWSAQDWAFDRQLQDAREFLAETERGA